MLIKINGISYEGYEGETLMDIAKRNNIHIPNLCHHKGFEGQGRCRLCMAEVTEGKRKKIVFSCVYPVNDGLEVVTDTDEIIKLRKNIILLLLLRTPNNNYINKLAHEYGVKVPKKYFDNDYESCILCGLCIEACRKLGTNAISFVNRGTTKKVSTPFDDASKDCIGCGACAEICPTNAISMKDINGKRIIWNKEFRLIKCSVCGNYYTTYEAVKYVKEKLNDSDSEYVCEACKKKLIGDNFKESFKNIY